MVWTNPPWRSITNWQNALCENIRHQFRFHTSTQNGRTLVTEGKKCTIRGRAHRPMYQHKQHPECHKPWNTQPDNHDNHASGLGGEHGEDSPGKYISCLFFPRCHSSHRNEYSPMNATRETNHPTCGPDRKGKKTEEPTRGMCAASTSVSRDAEKSPWSRRFEGTSPRPREKQSHRASIHVRTLLMNARKNEALLHTVLYRRRKSRNQTRQLSQ